ncbi:hypothetical protein [Oceanospirillum sanctuarii]|uniref:hypothetical protein n=1 Tax=Oceanospirillum sanctuarii TaxID=1434821 RepID=UPI000A36AA6D|nr:hypothetical protein [Oceanospirillum sanctuarii]
MRKHEIKNKNTKELEKILSDNKLKTGVDIDKLKCKEKFNITCTVCNFEFSNSLDNMRNTNNYCKVCSYAKTITEKFNYHSKDHNIINYEYSESLNPELTGKKGKPRHGAVATIVHKTCGTEIKHELHLLKSIFTESHVGNGMRLLRCDFCSGIEELNKIELEITRLKKSNLIESAKEIWGDKTKIKATNGGYIVSTPSLEGIYPNNEIPVQSIMPKNVKGRIKGQLEEEFISEKMLSKLINEDKTLIHKTEKLIEEARLYGAEIKNIAYIPPKNNRLYQGSSQKTKYRKQGEYYTISTASGNTSSLKTPFRLRETLFGRKEIRRSQTLLLCILKELFPYNEDGDPVIWEENNRKILENNWEIDIRGSNLIKENNGLMFEYQGHQSHLECIKTITRDKKKIEISKKLGYILIVINRFKKECVTAATEATLRAIKKHEMHHKISPLINKKIQIENIDRDYKSSIERKIREVYDAAKNIEKRYKHKILSEKKSFIKNEVLQYKCGNCGSNNSIEAKHFITKNTVYCPNCQHQKNSEYACNRRAEEYKSQLKNIWNEIDENIKSQIIEKPKSSTIKCPQCDKEVKFTGDKNALSKWILHFSKFLCPYCLNKGKIIFTNEAGLKQCIKAEKKCKKIMSELSFGDPEKWYNHIEFDNEKNEVILTIECNNGHISKHPPRKWTQILNSKKRNIIDSYCSHCHEISHGSSYDDGVHLERLKKFHPSAYFIHERRNGFFRASCGEHSKIGEFDFEHPEFHIDPHILGHRFRKYSRGETSFCYMCSLEFSWQLPGGKKTMSSINLRLKHRAAFIADMLGEHSIENASLRKTKNLYEEDVTSSETIIFQCHDVNHPTIKTTFNNLFNRHKPGYCKICLAKVFVSRFSDLTNKY